MQTSLSRARTLAPAASIAAISAWSPPLLLNFSLPLSLFPLHPPSLFQPNPYLSPFISFPGSPLILSQTRRLCFVSPRTPASSPQPWSWTGNASTGTTLPSSPPREVRDHSLLASLRCLTLAACPLDYIELRRPFSECSISTPPTSPPFNDHKGVRGLRKCKPSIVRSPEAALSSGRCTPLSSLAVQFIKPREECCAVPHIVWYSTPGNHLIYTAQVIGLR